MGQRQKEERPMLGKQIETPDRLAESIKELYHKKGRELTDNEAQEASFNLTGFFKLLIEIDREQKQNKKDFIQA